MRLLSYNIKYGGTGRAAPLAAVVRAADADVVVLQEASDPRVVEALARAAGYPTWGAHRGRSTGFLSRIPVAHHAWHHAPEARHPFLEIVLADRDCRIFGLHLNAWFSKWSERKRVREIHALFAAIRRDVAASGGEARAPGFHLVAGDFNALAPGELLEVPRLPRWIRAMVWISGRDIARDTIQAMLDEGYADAWRRTHPRESGFTFPTWDPHVRLDYVFLPEPYAERLSACRVLETPEGKTASDHYPLLVEVAE